MLLLRLLGVLVAIAIASGVAAYMVSGDKRFLRLSARLAKYALIVAFVFLALLALERVIAL